MACSRNLVLLLCVALAGTSMAEQKPKKDDGKTATAPKKKDKTAPKGEGKPDKKVEANADKPAREPTPKAPPKLQFDVLPTGQDSKKVVIPYADENGKKTMSFQIGVGRKIDENTVKMTNLLIEMYNDTGVREMSVAMPAATLDMPTRVIRGDQSVTIKRSDFEITGKEMEFNTDTRKGSLKGDVKMIIYDLSEETDGASNAEEAKEPAPKKTAPKTGGKSS
jgi:hypothetical protein